MVGMEEKELQAKIEIEIEADDWEGTPESVRKLVWKLWEKVKELEERVKELEVRKEELKEKAESNSSNSNQAPASDGPEVEKKKKRKRRRKRGGQEGHEGKSRRLYSVNRLRTEASLAVEKTVAEAKAYVQSAEIVGADETGFRQGNADGKNPDNKKGWLWVAVTPLVSFFQVTLSRSRKAAESLLGEDFAGKLNSDRYGAYNWVEIEQRQLCWAHLKREFIKISERSGLSRQIGRDLLAQQKKLFRLWHRVRDGTQSRGDFALRVEAIRERLQQILQQAAELEIGSKEKTPLAKTVRTCRQLLKMEPALWLFVTIEGLEPTNNAAERAIRPAVLWRRTSFGSQSEAGSLFLARMLTVVTTLRSQNRDVLDFLTEAIRAARHGLDSPSILPC